MTDQKKREITRRDIMKTVVIGGVATMIVLPGKWTRPVIDSVVTPALAQASAPGTTGTTSTTATTTGTTVTTPAPG